MERGEDVALALARLIAPVLSSAALLGACGGVANVYGSSDASTPPDAGSGSAGVAGGGAGASGSAGAAGSAGAPAPCGFGECWWSTPPDAGCGSVGMPTPSDRPPATAGSDVPDIYVGMTRVWMGESMPTTQLPAVPDPSVATKPSQWIGLDLDGICSDPVACDSEPQGQVGCRSRNQGSDSGVVLPDGVGCRDNALADIQPAMGLPSLGGGLGLTEADFNCELYRGGFNIVFKLSGYNGTDNDDQVRLDVYASPGLEDALPPWDCLTDKDHWAEEPPWQGTQRWYADRAGLDGSPGSGALPAARTTFDAAAYVRQGYLVAQLPFDAALRFIGDRATQRPADSSWPAPYLPGGLELKLWRGMVIGRIHKNAGAVWVIDDGLIAGAVRADDLVKAFRQQGLCDANDLSLAQAIVSSSADVLANLAVSPDVDCDALSVGIAFAATSVTPGDAYDVSTLNDCAPQTPP